MLLKRIYNMMKSLKIICLMLFASLAAVVMAKDYSPADVENVNLRDRREFVADPAGLLSPSVKTAVNERLQTLLARSTCEMAVVVIPSIGDTPIEDWSEELFTKWGIGKADKDNGVLLVIAVDNRKVRIQTGYGVEGVLTDVACANIIRQTIVSNMREGKIDDAVNESTALIFDALTDPAVADELRSEQEGPQGENDVLSKEVIWEFLFLVMGIAFMFNLTLFCYDLFSISRGRFDSYQKSMMWRKHLVSYLIGGVISAGTGLIFFLLALFLYRVYRTRPHRCPTCGKRMKRLSEEQDNELLTDSQDFEEKLKTVDYDVWECPHCGTVQRYPYKSNQKKYTECPACHTVAMCLECDTVLVPPTTRREGHGERLYECKFCHHQHRKPYRIPKKSDDSGALIAGAVIGSALGRGGGGGGGFGGGFGGGSTGGGGASGGW